MLCVLLIGLSIVIRPTCRSDIKLVARFARKFIYQETVITIVIVGQSRENVTIIMLELFVEILKQCFICLKVKDRLHEKVVFTQNNN